MSALSSRIDEVDVMVEKVHRLIDSGARLDPELAAGVATSENMSAVQRKLDQAAAGVEALDGHLRDLARART